MPIANHHVVISGAIVVVSVVGAAAIAISQIPEVREFAEDCRRKIAVALHSLGDEINPNRAQQPRYNRPEDAEGFMQPHAAGGEMDADEESRRRQREELMYWNAIKMQNLERQKANPDASKGPTFDDILRNNSSAKEGASAIKTGAEIQSEESTFLRRRGEGSRGMDRGSMLANPFADENYLEADADAKMIGPEDDEMSDIYTDNDLRKPKKPTPEKRVLAAASDYPLGQHHTMQLKNLSSAEPQSDEQDPSSFQQHVEYQMRSRELTQQNEQQRLEAYTRSHLAYLLSQERLTQARRYSEVEQQNEERLRTAERDYPELSTQAVWNSTPDTTGPVSVNANLPNGHDQTMQYDVDQVLMNMSIKNEKRLIKARQLQALDAGASEAAHNQAKVAVEDSLPGLNSFGISTSNSPATLNHEEPRVNVSEALNDSPHNSITLPTAAHDSSEPEAHSQSTFASIHAWADNSHASFYSPLPGTPRALSSVASEPEDVSGEMTPTDSMSLVGSGDDVANDNASSVGGGRYDEVQSIDGGISTPGSWSEIGSVVSEDDASRR